MDKLKEETMERLKLMMHPDIYAAFCRELDLLRGSPATYGPTVDRLKQMMHPDVYAAFNREMVRVMGEPVSPGDPITTNP